MRALWVTATLHPEFGGVQTYVAEAMRSLSSQMDTALVCADWQFLPGSDRLEVLQCPDLGRFTSAKGWRRTCKRLSGIIDAFGADVVHLATAGMAAYIDAIDDSIPVVATVHGNDLTHPWQPVESGERSAVLAQRLARCRKVFCVSHHTAALVAPRVPQVPLEVLSPGCDLNVFRPRPKETKCVAELGLSTDLPVVLTVARVASRKGQLNVLRALELIQEPVQWVVLGTGVGLETLRREVASSPVRDRVRLLQSVPLETLVQLYSACDVFVLTPETLLRDSLIDSEGFGLVFHEAGASGKACIGSDVAGCREAIVDGSTGLLVPPGDPAALAEALHRLLTQPALRHGLGSSASTHVQRVGGWKAFATRLMAAYRDLVAR